MSATRLLVLGVVRIFQPVHGYFVRRELLSWHVDEWASVNPGSIYNALRTLTREGYLEEVATDAGGRPARTTYRFTADGETEFFSVLRSRCGRWTPGTPSG
jgi:DNA-binding PadR family transcriptional regulator